jgi:signal transduction histidine kinase
MGTISEAGRRMARLIDDLLQFSRTNREEMRLAEVVLEGLVKEAIEELRAEAGRRCGRRGIGAVFAGGRRPRSL